MTLATPRGDSIASLDAHTAQLVRTAVAVAAGSELEVREAMSAAAASSLDPVWVEELILQSHLFAGFPRALNAARAWRKASGRSAPRHDRDAEHRAPEEWRARGERTCAIVYGDAYQRLRANIRELHPALDAWMIVDGYGKVLSRVGLDLRRRELCIVAVCAALEQDRQLHAHLHGALNAGATSGEVQDVLQLVAPRLSDETNRRFALLWARVERRG